MLCYGPAISLVRLSFGRVWEMEVSDGKVIDDVKVIDESH
jgi:hypothetical protein